VSRKTARGVAVTVGKRMLVLTRQVVPTTVMLPKIDEHPSQPRKVQ
jgi:hypothetical protein